MKYATAFKETCLMKFPSLNMTSNRKTNDNTEY